MIVAVAVGIGVSVAVLVAGSAVLVAVSVAGIGIGANGVGAQAVTRKTSIRSKKVPPPRAGEARWGLWLPPSNSPRKRGEYLLSRSLLNMQLST